MEMNPFFWTKLLVFDFASFASSRGLFAIHASRPAKFTNGQALTVFPTQEVTTIILSAQVFGDEITPVNMMGVGITSIGVFYYYLCAVGTITRIYPLGIGLFAYHRYQKSVHSPTPLDTHGDPIAGEEYDTEEDVDAAEVAPLEVFDGRETEPDEGAS